MTKAEMKDFMADLCADYHCTEDEAKKHAEILIKHHWICHPSRLFKEWWEPTGFAANGASRGGHREARRCWVRLEDGEQRWYGIGAVQAFNTEHFREEFRQWLRDGMNPEWHNWDSTTAPEDRIRQLLRDCMKEVQKGVVCGPIATAKYAMQQRMKSHSDAP